MDSVSNNSVIDGLRRNPAATAQTNENEQALNQEDFFALLTQQLSFQDPTKPVENDQMISQMTSFTMADGISSLNNSFESFAASMTSNQALQASSLVGQQVLIPGDLAMIRDGASLTGTYSTPVAAKNTKMIIEDEKGQIIRSVDLEDAAAGKHAFVWDGLNNDGEPVADGVYKIKIQSKLGKENVSLPISTVAHVESVSIGGNGSGVMVNTNNGSVKLADIEAIGGG